MLKVLCRIIMLVKVLIWLAMAARQWAFSVLLRRKRRGARDELDCPGQKEARMFMV